MPTVLTSAQLADIDSPVGPPSRVGIVGELGTVLQPARLLIGGSKLRRAPRGDGRISVFLPGWKAPEVSTFPLRGYLKSLGHDARSWGLGTNQGNVEAKRDEMLSIVEELAATSGRPVNLIGWSLGGVVAREIARTLADSVHRLVTYGSPIVGGPSYTAGWATYPAEERARISALQQHLDATNPIATPTTSIFTRNDTVVDWRACIDRSSLDVTTVEVGSTHVGLGLDPDVWYVVAHALGENVER